MNLAFEITYIKRLGKWFQPYDFSVNGKQFATDTTATINFLPSAMADSQVQSLDYYIKKYYGENTLEIRFKCSTTSSPEDEDKFILVGSFEDGEIGSGMSYRSEKDLNIVARVCWDGIRKIVPNLPDDPDLPTELYIKKVFDKKAKKDYPSYQNEAKIKRIQELHEAGLITKEEMEDLNEH